jgi:prophage antirepressor-like protein
MELVLNGQKVKVHRFSDDPEMPWFQARPIVTYLGYRNPTTTLDDHVYPEDKMSLQLLIEGKGKPLGGGSSQLPPLGYNELKAIHINEPALYSLIFGSQKPEAKEFKKYVCTTILPSIRRHGFFGYLKKRDDDWQIAQRGRDDSLQLALRQRDDAVQLVISSVNTAVTSGFDERLVRLEEALGRRYESNETRFSALLTSTFGNLVGALNVRDDRLMSSLREYSAAQLEAARVSFSELLTSRFSSFILSLAGHINSSVTAAVAAGLGLKKAQPKKKTTNAREMPEDQRATPLQTGPLSLGLSTVAVTMFPEMPFAVWRKIKGSFGLYAKKERLRLHALGERHSQYVAMPLLWAYTGSGSTVEGGGARYVYLAEHNALLQRVFRAQLQTSRSQRKSGAPAPTESLEQRAHRLAAHLSPAERGVQWPIHVAELEPQWNEGEEGV